MLLCFIVTFLGKSSGALTATGIFYGWGSNTCGQLGIFSEGRFCRGFYWTPVQMESSLFHRFKVTLPYGLCCNLGKFVTIGHAHSAAITTAGELFTWGCMLVFIIELLLKQ